MDKRYGIHFTAMDESPASVGPTPWVDGPALMNVAKKLSHRYALRDRHKYGRTAMAQWTTARLTLTTVGTLTKPECHSNGEKLYILKQDRGPKLRSSQEAVDSNPSPNFMSRKTRSLI